MAIDYRAILEIASMRAEMDRHLASIDDDLARAWGTAWGEISDEFTAAAEDLIELGDGDWPTRRQILRSQRSVNAMKAAADAITDLSKGAAARTVGNLRSVIDSTEHWQRRIVAAQLPSSDLVDWARVDSKALGSIVRRATQQIESALRPLPADVQSKMKATLIRGVAVGDNPNAAASQMVRKAEGAFNGGLRRARNIARTEMLDAHRASATASRKANSDTLRGWRWLCSLSARTCPSCLAQNGSVHDITEPGPHDHQSGRCTAVPITKTWRELGIDLDEPADQFPNAREWFNSQPRATQLHIMGPERLKRLENGSLSWGQMSTRVETPGWRSSYHVTPLGGNGSPDGPDAFPEPQAPAGAATRTARWQEGRDVHVGYDKGTRSTVGPDFDPDNPLKFYGDRVVIEDDSEVSANHLTQLEKLPPGAHHSLRRWYGGSDHGGFYVGEKPVTELDDLGNLRGVQPRGWGHGRKFDEVNGVYSPRDKVCACGHTKNTVGRKKDNTALHEASHVIDDIRSVSSGQRFAAIADRMQDGRALSPYYTRAWNGDGYRSELFAQSHGAWAEAVHDRLDRDGVNRHIRNEIGAGLASEDDVYEMMDYFSELESEALELARRRK